eukprot:518552-Pelagomonas_calceolata.AAC.1
MEALQTSQPLHAHDFVRRQYKIQIRWSKRAYTGRQRDVLIGRLYSKDPDVHAMLRRTKRTQTIPVWDKYLQAYFWLQEAAEMVCGGVATRDMAVPLGLGRDVEALLRQGSQNN